MMPFESEHCMPLFGELRFPSSCSIALLTLEQALVTNSYDNILHCWQSDMEETPTYKGKLPESAE